MNVERLQKMAGAVRTGGKGSMRRKKKGNHKAIQVDDKKLQSTLKRLHVTTMSVIEEVIIFKDDVVIHYETPKVQAYPPGNTWVVSGSAKTKKLVDILGPEMYQHLGSENRESVERLSNQYQRPAPGRARPRATLTPLDEDSDDDVPELADDETFEESSESDYYY